MIKRTISFILCCLLLTGCDVRTYEEGYNDGYGEGYDEGYSDASWEYEDNYSNGYEYGYDDGYRHSSSEYSHEFEAMLEMAKDYAWEQSGCSVMEALDIIGVYHDQDNPLYSDIQISEEEYLQAIDSLIYFYEYINDADFE